MAMSPTQFRDRAAVHAETALTVAAEIVGNEELSPAVRLEAGKWLTKVADLEPKVTQDSRGDKFSIVIHLDDQKLVLAPPIDQPTSMLDRLLNID